MALTLFRANECSLYRPSRCSHPGLGSSMQLSCCERCLDGLSEGVYPRSQNRTSGSACLFVCVCFACSLAEDQGPKVLLACLFVSWLRTRSNSAAHSYVYFVSWFHSLLCSLAWHMTFIMMIHIVPSWCPIVTTISIPSASPFALILPAVSTCCIPSSHSVIAMTPVL